MIYVLRILIPKKREREREEGDKGYERVLTIHYLTF